MPKNRMIIILLFTMINCYVFSDDASINHFIWPSDEPLNIIEYDYIIGDFQTFYRSIVDLKPKFTIYCIKGYINGEEVLLGNKIVTIDITYILSNEHFRILRNNFKHDFLNSGYIRLEVINDILIITAENTGENLYDYFETIFSD